MPCLFKVQQPSLPLGTNLPHEGNWASRLGVDARSLQLS